MQFCFEIFRFVNLLIPIRFNKIKYIRIVGKHTGYAPIQQTAHVRFAVYGVRMKQKWLSGDKRFPFPTADTGVTMSDNKPNESNTKANNLCFRMFSSALSITVFRIKQ